MTGGVLLDYAPTALAWGAVAYRSPAFFRGHRESGLRYFWFGLLALASGLTMLLPPVYLAIDQTVGIHDVARPVAHGLVLVAAWCVQTFLLFLNSRDADARPATRRTGIVLLASLIMLGVFFWMAHLQQDSLDFANRYADNTAMVGYRLVLLTYLAMVMVNAVRLPWRYADVTGSRPSLHLGLRLVALGAAVGLVYIAYGVVYLAARRLQVDYLLGNGEDVSGFLLAICIVLILIGATMPAWGPSAGIPAIDRWMIRYRSLRRLYPLWRDLCTACPGIAFQSPSGPIADALAFRGLGFRLHRRVVEIRDGQLALRLHVAPRVESHAAILCQKAGLSDGSAVAVMEAVRVAAGLRARARGKEFAGSGVSFRRTGGADLPSEADFLGQVAHYYANSPIVQEAIARVEGEESDVTSTIEEVPTLVNPEAEDRDSSVSMAGIGNLSRRRMARLITELLAPAPTVALLLIVMAWHSATTTVDAVRWAIVAVLFASLLPFLYLLRRVRQRRLTDIHVHQREQRPKVLLVGITSVAVGLGILALGGAPRELVALVAAMVMGLAVCTLVTLFWKVSFHTAVTAGAVVILTLVFGWPLLALAPLVGLMGWARVEIRDHTLPQVVVGAMLGAVVAASVFTLLR